MIGSSHPKGVQSNKVDSILIVIVDIPNINQNFLESESSFDQIKATSAWEIKGVGDILEEAVFVVVVEEILPHAFLVTDIAFNNLELTEMGFEIIHTPLEVTPPVLVGAGDV